MITTEYARSEDLFARLSTQDRSGNQYDVYESTQATIVDRPLIVYLGLGTSAKTELGRMYLGAHAVAASRKILHLAPESVAWETFAERAASDADIITRYDKQVDILGMSSGALFASYVAAELGDQANSLMTVSAVGTHRGVLRYLMQLPRQAGDTIGEVIRMWCGGQTSRMIGKKALGLAKGNGVHEYFWTIQQSMESSLEVPISRLSPETNWHDIVGTRDAMTDWRDHAILHKTMDQRHPGNSTLTVESNQGHMWASRAHDIARWAESHVGL